MSEICFLHIGKTGGTAVSSLLRRHRRKAGRTDIQIYPHRYSVRRLRRLRPDAKLVFFVRDPVSRFVSGYFSRLRQGRPRYNAEWTAAEAEAFTRFPDIETLCAALAGSKAERDAAEAAIQAIQHTRLDYPHYLGSTDVLEKAKAHILMIGNQTDFGRDVGRLKDLLNIPPELDIPRDPVKAHRNAYPEGFTLSAEADAILHTRLAADYELYDWCRNFSNSRG